MIALRTAVAGLVALACQAAQVYRVAGVIVNSQTGAPLPHARIVMFKEQTTNIAARMVTGDDGRFAFDLPEGKYSLSGGTRDQRQLFGMRSSLGISTAVITGPGKDTSQIVFRWYPPGAIHGTVVDERGDKVEGARVQLLLSRVLLGRRVTSTVAWTHTDDRGEYRFGALPAATYYLAVTGAPWYSIWGGQQVESPQAYRPAYSGGASDPARAGAVVVGAGEESRADFTLAAIPAVRVIVKHTAPEGMTGSIWLTMDGIGDSPGFQRQDTFRGGNATHVFSAVPAGRYVLRIAGSVGNQSYSASKEVDAHAAETTLEIAIRPWASVSGTVKLQNPDAKPRGSILAGLVPPSGAGGISTIVRPDGTFHFPAAAPGKWRPAVRGVDAFFATDIHVDGADYRDGLIDLEEGGSVTLNMVASDEIGTAKGFVEVGGQAIEGVLALLIPEGLPSDSIRYRAYQTDSDGSFEFRNVPAGDYYLVAVEDTALEYANPEIVKAYIGKARRIRIPAHQSVSENIPLAK